MFEGKAVSSFLDFNYDANHDDFIAAINRISISGVQEKLSAILYEKKNNSYTRRRAWTIYY